MLSITLLGTGTMGFGMAGQLLQAGFPLTVWNRHAERAAPLAARGARIAGSPRDAARDADVIIAMLADDNASRSAWLGSEGALAGAKEGAIAIESSTLTPAWVRELAEQAKQHGLDFMDAPVTGSRTQAAEGQLLFLIGGAAETLERARPVFDAMGRGLLHLGPVGSGAVIKLVNNFVCGVQVAALAEAIALIEHSGLQREQALSVLTEGAPGSPLVKGVSQRMLQRDYGVHFRAALMGKDLTYAIAEGKQHGIALATAAAALQSFERAKEAGLGDQDIAAVIEPLR